MLRPLTTLPALADGLSAFPDMLINLIFLLLQVLQQAGQDLSFSTGLLFLYSSFFLTLNLELVQLLNEPSIGIDLE